MTDKLRLGAILFTLVAIGGCETSPTATETDYGNSVRSMVRNQTVNPGPADTATVDAGDGERAQNSIDVYRKDVAQPEQVNKEIEFGLGDR
jgi:hypothetical protein